jgi:hypothetical protein
MNTDQKPVSHLPVLLFSVLLSSLVSASSYAEDCVKIEVVNDQCQSSSIKANLEACEDDLIAIQKPVCKNDQMVVTLRGKESDYRLILRSSNEAWGAKSWAVVSERELDHRPTAKTLPKSEHERPSSPGASIEIPAQSPGPNEPKVASAFVFSAYFDAYLEYNFNRPRPIDANRTPQNNLRFYDWYSNQVGLNLAELTIKHTRKDTSFVMDLDFGQFADANTNSVTMQSSGGPVTSTTVDELSKHIGQAVFTYNPKSAPNWVFEIGKMPTHIGLELNKPKDNWNYTRSSIFSFAAPFWHTGMHLGYTFVPNVFQASAYLYNGWNTVYDNNFSPTYGAQLKWTPSERFTWVYNYIGGAEQAHNNFNWRQVHETNLSLTLNPTVSIASDFIYGTEKGALSDGSNASWYAAQLGAKWQTSPTFYVSPRLEYYRDPQGYTLSVAGNTPTPVGIGQTLYSVTLTESFLISDGFEFRLEERLDHSTQNDRFITGTGTSANQPGVIMGLLYAM